VLRINKRQTVYGDYVHEQILEIAQQGGGTWIFMYLADKLGLKATNNLRKRLRTEEANGLLTIGIKCEPGRGSCLTYTIHPLPGAMSPRELEEFAHRAAADNYDFIDQRQPYTIQPKDDLSDIPF